MKKIKAMKDTFSSASLSRGKVTPGFLPVLESLESLEKSWKMKPAPGNPGKPGNSLEKSLFESSIGLLVKGQ